MHDKEKQKENSDCSQQPEQEKKSCVSGITIELHGDTDKQQPE